MASSAAAALEVDDNFSPAVGAYTPVSDTLELADLPPAVYSRGATAEKVSELKGRHPQGTCLELLRFLKARDGDVDKVTLPCRWCGRRGSRRCVLESCTSKCG